MVFQADVYAIKAYATEYRQGLKNIKITDSKVVITALYHYQTHSVPNEAYQTLQELKGTHSICNSWIWAFLM